MKEERILFVYSFLYELEQQLNANIHIFDNVTFQSDEANTDKEAKFAVKNFIIEKMTGLQKINSISIFDNSVSVLNCQIINVYVQEEIPMEQKLNLINEAKNKSKVYKNPDLLLEINEEGEIWYQAIELKSTKDNKIPGSSVQQISPNDPVIFIKHNSNKIEVSTGIYLNAITEIMQFPDRSPRPQVAYNTLKNWNNTHRIINGDELKILPDNSQDTKHMIFKDWQKVLSNRWVDMLFSSSIKKKEPWFNTNMRKFIIQFLEKYESLSAKEKNDFRSSIMLAIQENGDDSNE